MQVKVLKGFNNGNGAGAPFVRKGATIEVDETRGKELQRSGLVEGPGDKQAPAPANKMKPRGKNKAGEGEQG